MVPQDVECEDFHLIYTRIASHNQQPQSQQQQQHAGLVDSPTTTKSGMVFSSLETDIDRHVDDAIESFLRTLSQIGPELLSGCLTLSFYERRASRQLFGLVSHEERVVFEQWILRIVVNNTPRPIGNDTTAIIERQRLQDTAEGMLRACLWKIFECTGGPMDHIPPVMYGFDISCAKRVDDREHVYARVANMPPILNLTN